MHGVPVVSLKVDPDNLIQRNGLGFVSSSMTQLSNDVDGIIREESLWNDISSRCRAYAEKSFFIEQKADELENLLNTG